MKNFIIALFLFSILAACAPLRRFPTPAVHAVISTILASDSSMPEALWISPAIPSKLVDLAQSWEIPITENPILASQKLDIAETRPESLWVYALVAPFPTVADNITSQEFLSAWKASSYEAFGKTPLLMEESTLITFTARFGAPAQGAVQVVSADLLLETAWKQMPSWAIIPFEKIEPKWKVLTIDGQSPIQKRFDPKTYPLVAAYQLTCVNDCQPLDIDKSSFQNRDPNKLATVIMTGVTALVRGTAERMDRKGILYPAEEIGDMLREADITHINNEVPFYGGCPPPDPNQEGLVFCSDPDYIQLLTVIGTDVIELSGDHFADYGQNAMFETINIYKANHLPYYGGGLNVEDGRKPLLLEVNGNKLMFIGCNYKVDYASATDTIPGSVPCDFDYETKQITHYRSLGYLPIATFQYHEFRVPAATPQQMIDFRTMADAGAVIVSGSQAHVPQVMEFYGGSFIHYGLGNLFFDQFLPITRREFIDRHVFYDGRYLGVELITTSLEDYSRPRYMTPAERTKFLTEYFDDSGWHFTQAGQ
jgi:poly-gamma-glutamate synthesis protein (capsule biosynthesis protein)